MLVELTFRKDGKIAELIYPKNGLTIAKFLVQGPWERNIKAILKNYDEGFNAIVSGIGDDEYIDERTCTIKKVRTNG